MIAAVGFAIKYLPIIVAAVTFVQNFADGSTSGEARKALATKFVRDTLRGLGVPVTARTEELIGILINLAVSVLNAFGIFQSEAGPVAEVVAVAAPVAIETRIPTASDARLDEIEAFLVR